MINTPIKLLDKDACCKCGRDNSNTCKTYWDICPENGKRKWNDYKRLKLICFPIYFRRNFALINSASIDVAVI